jgi:hypothetical protein
MVLQVLLLMPIRTIMNYQYRHGTSLSVAAKTLYHDGGMGRYYQGMGAALFQGTMIPFLHVSSQLIVTSKVLSHASVTQRPMPASWLC